MKGVLLWELIPVFIETLLDFLLNLFISSEFKFLSTNEGRYKFNWATRSLAALYVL